MTSSRPSPAADRRRSELRVVIAPDSFKGSASASAVASALAAGWRRVRSGDDLRLLPIADGGEGTMDSFEIAFPEAERRPVRVTGPDDRAIDTYWLRLPDGRGVIELAATSGLPLLAQLQPLSAHTAGFGEAIAHAISEGVTGLILALGGSASTDGGAGALMALGAELLDEHGGSIARGNAGLGALRVAHLDAARSALPPTVILGDVSNPLTGPRGAAAVFGPQKGADAAQLATMDAHLAHFADVIGLDPRIAGAGAAGGTAYGFLALGAQIRAGSDVVLEMLQLEDVVRGADLVVTGEGHYDSQSSSGKGPFAVARTALEADVPVALVAGGISAPTDDFTTAISLSRLAGSTKHALEHTENWLSRAGEELASGFSPTERAG